MSAFRPSGAVIHCSASRWGDEAAIAAWHIARGCARIGYHAVILNGRATPSNTYSLSLDGQIRAGRPESVMGAHCPGMDRRALGVCLIGLPGWGEYPTARQQDSLVSLLVGWCRRYGFGVEGITQHSDHEPQRRPLCASLDMDGLRARAAAAMESTDVHVLVSLEGADEVLVAGHLSDGRVLLPAKEIAAALGFAVSWSKHAPGVVTLQDDGGITEVPAVLIERQVFVFADDMAREAGAELVRKEGERVLRITF